MKIRDFPRPVPALSWLLAGLVSAFCAHGCIDRTGAWLNGKVDAHAGAYTAHTHVALVPLGLIASMLLVSMLLAVAARAVSHQKRDPHGKREGDGVKVLAQELSRIRLAPAIGLVALGGFAILIAMEFAEQFVTAGHVAGITEALGGNVGLGLSIVAIVAAACTTLGLRIAGAFVAVTAATAISIASWIVGRLDAALVDVLSAAAKVRRPRGRAGAVPGLYTSSCRGLRAPPPLLR